MLDKIIFIGYGIFLLVGGYFGWKKGSMVSLGMGIGSGLMMFLGIWLMTLNPRGGMTFLACVTGFLSAVFIIRLVKTHAFMPAGMLLIFSLAVLAYCLYRLPQLPICVK